jgi:hypothetical protein
MNDDQWTGFLMGCAIGFDLDSDDVEAILTKARLSKANSLTACQYAIKNHVGEAAWKRGLAAIREVSG